MTLVCTPSHYGAIARKKELHGLGFLDPGFVNGPSILGKGVAISSLFTPVCMAL